jgi:biopolymer transport protein ExbD
LFGERLEKTIFVKSHHVIQYQYLIKTMDVIKQSGVDTISVIPTPHQDGSEQRPIPVYRNNRI